MSNRGHLIVTAQSGSAPDAGGHEIAEARYAIPVGWLLTTLGETPRSYVSPDVQPAMEFCYFEMPITTALRRLEGAMSSLKQDEYLWPRFRFVEELKQELSKYPGHYLQIDAEEILCAVGSEGRDQLLKEVPTLLQAFIGQVETRRRSEATATLNRLEPISGMRLYGSREKDEQQWAMDLEFLGLSDVDDLCRWWMRGVFVSDPS